MLNENKIQPVESNPQETVLEKPFPFTIDRWSFRVSPLSMHDYFETERHIHRSLAATYYYSVSRDNALQKLLNLEDDTLSALERAKTIIDVVVAIIEPIPFWIKIAIFAKHNSKYWYTPSRWVWSLSDWFERRLSYSQVTDLAAYIMEFCGELKKKIFQILQTGITNASALHLSSDQTSLGSTEEVWKQGYLSAGVELLGIN